MTRDERDYLLNIINIQDGMITSYAQKNMSKFVTLQKELEKQQKASFKLFIEEKKEAKRELQKRFNNLLTEISSVVKELGDL